jgi:hypothetical protein
MFIVSRVKVRATLLVRLARLRIASHSKAAVCSLAVDGECKGTNAWLAPTRKLLEVTCRVGVRKCPALHPTLLDTSHCICIEAQIHVMLKDCMWCSVAGCESRRSSRIDCQDFLHAWLFVPASPQ